MKKRSLLWRVVPWYFAIIAIAIVAVGWDSAAIFKKYYLAEVRGGLEARARLITDLASPLLTPSSKSALDSLCKELGSVTATRITIVRDDGKVWDDSYEQSEKMENHSDRPEIRQALAGGIGNSVRFSPTLKIRMLYLAIPLKSPDGTWTGALRVAVPLSDLNQTFSRNRAGIAAGGLAVLIAALILIYLTTQGIQRPLVEVESAAQRFASGDLRHRLPGSSFQEFDGLNDSLNQMASQLEERFQTINRQRTELESIIANMSEGILAVDNNERLIRVNHAAAAMLSIGETDGPGRGITELIRTPDLLRFISDLVTNGIPIEGDFTLEEPWRHLHAQGTTLRGEDHRIIGGLVVLSDLTRLHKLERIRSDFAANVSHELRTPITAAKGYLETLRDDPTSDPGQTTKFLDISLKHLDRLNAIIEDLLRLARLEQETGQVELKNTDLEAVAEAAINSCLNRAQQRNVTLVLEPIGSLWIRANGQLLEQALTNLLDNAIKYSNPGGTVEIGSEHSSNEVVIKVSDKGCGIEEQHLPRLFERFYRVDADRSRKLGGTGLGLAIVKHIILAHNGHMSVESEIGRGSAFKIHLPTT